MRRIGEKLHSKAMITRPLLLITGEIPSFAVNPPSEADTGWRGELMIGILHKKHHELQFHKHPVYRS